MFNSDGLINWPKICELVIMHIIDSKSLRKFYLVSLPVHGPRWSSAIDFPSLHDFCRSSQRLRYVTPSAPHTILLTACVRFLLLPEHFGHVTHCGTEFWSSMQLLPLEHLMNWHEPLGEEGTREIAINSHYEALITTSLYFCSLNQRNIVVVSRETATISRAFVEFVFLLFHLRKNECKHNSLWMGESQDRRRCLLTSRRRKGKILNEIRVLQFATERLLSIYNCTMLVRFTCTAIFNGASETVPVMTRRPKASSNRTIS